jgi:hypothetical protein
MTIWTIEQCGAERNRGLAFMARNAAPQTAQVLALPSNWWQNSRRVRVLDQLFLSHFVALHIPFVQNGREQHEIFTGFPVALTDDFWIWITAGHSLDTLQDMRATSGVRIGNMRWMDNFRNVNASGMPAVVPPDSMFSARPFGYDWGCVVLSPMYVALLKSNHHFRPLNPEVWRDPLGEPAEGYFLFGAPRSQARVTQLPEAPGYVGGLVHVNTECLPAEELTEVLPGTEPEFWTPPHSRFFRLVPFADTGSHGVADIRGMSGGPMFSILRTSAGQFKYRLIGVQSAWLDQSRVCRTVDIRHIVSVIRTQLPGVPHVN